MNLKNAIKKNEKNIIKVFISILILVLLVLYAIAAYNRYIVNRTKRERPQSSINFADETDVKNICLNSEDVIKQWFVGDHKGISLIRLRAPKNVEGKVSISLNEEKDDKILQTWDVKLSEEIKLKLDKKIYNSNNKSYYIKVSSRSDKGLNLLMSKNNENRAFSCFKNNNKIEGTLLFEIIPNKKNYDILKYEFWFLFSIMLVSIFLILLFSYIRDRMKIEWIFLIFMVTFGLCYLLVLPPFAAPDEPRHFVTSYYNSNQILGIKQSKTDTYVICREEDDDSICGITIDRETYRAVLTKLFKTSNKTKINSRLFLGKLIEESMFITHLPQALGITIARLLHFNYITTIYMAQLFSLIFYTIMVFFAIKIIPVGKYILFVISGFPMVMQEATSCGYDIIIMGMVFFFIAYIFNIIYKREKITLKNCIIIMLLIILFSPCKLVYCVVPLLVYLIPTTLFINKKQAYIYKNFAFLCGVIVAMICNMNAVTGNTSGTKYIEWANEEGYTVGYLLCHISKLFNIIITTLYEKVTFYIEGIIGNGLGWYDISIPVDLTIASAVLIIFAINNNQTDIDISLKHKALYLLIAAISVSMTCASMLLAWTPISYNIIEGVQGRYFLPILPLILLCFADKKRYNMNNRNVIIIGNFVVNYMVVVRVFQTVIMR